MNYYPHHASLTLLLLTASPMYLFKFKPLKSFVKLSFCDSVKFFCNKIYFLSWNKQIMHASKTILKVRHTRLIFTQFYTIYLRTSFFTKAVFFLRLESNLLKKDSSGRFSTTFFHIWYIAEKYIRDEKKQHIVIFMTSQKTKQDYFKAKLSNFKTIISWTIDCISKSGSDRPPYDSTCCFLVSFP